MSPALWILAKAVAGIYAAGFLYVLLSKAPWKPCAANCMNCQGAGCSKYALRVAALWPAILVFVLLKEYEARKHRNEAAKADP